MAVREIHALGPQAEERRRELVSDGVGPEPVDDEHDDEPSAFRHGGYASALRGGLVSSRITMKICFFHLMPYRFLPDDFENRYRSVWVDVPHSLYDPEKTSRLYHEFLDELEFAEAQGFPAAVHPGGEPRRDV